MLELDSRTGHQCLSIESPIAWNARGVAGPQGPKGDKGDAGVSDATLRRGAEAVAISPNVAFDPIASVDLPAGQYAITATGNIWNTKRDSTTACELLGTSPPADPQAYVTSAGAQQTTLALTGVADIGDARTIRIGCVTQDADVQGHAQILAVKIGELK